MVTGRPMFSNLHRIAVRYAEHGAPVYIQMLEAFTRYLSRHLLPMGLQ